MNTLILAIEPTTQFVSPIETYFGFIVLGLMLTIGYVVVRNYGKNRQKAEARSLEESLKQAELEAYARRQSAQAGEAGEVLPLAPLSPEQEVEQARARRLLKQREDHNGEKESS